MGNYVNAHIVTGPDTDMWLHTHRDKGFTVVAMGHRLGSELHIHLRPAEIDRLTALLDQARHELSGQSVRVAA